MTPTPVDPPVYPPIIKLEIVRGGAKLSFFFFFDKSGRGQTIIECCVFITLHNVHSNKYGSGYLSAGWS